MQWPRTGRLTGVLVAVALAIAPAEAHAAVTGPNPHDHGFVPALTSHGQPAQGLGASQLAGFSGALGTPPLIYQGGPVAPSSTVYAIFWDPPSAPNHFAQSYKDLIGQYFTDLAATSGHPTDTNEVSQQYTDAVGTGHRASYSVTYGGSLDDTTPYPTSGQCTSANGDSVCLNDDTTHNQIQNEVTSFVKAHGLPIDLTHVYFLFTPAGVSSCDGVNSCSYQAYCAYHRFTDASTVPLYSNQPDDAWPGCTSSQLQEPNGNDADITLNSVAHEHNETITDPQGNSWFDSSGYEIGDECAYTFGTELGGASGAQFNELINDHPYQLQQEYSNAQAGCMGSIPLSAGITGAPMSPVPAGQQITLNGSTSSEPGGTIAAYAWDFGDRSGAAAGASASHTYTAPGVYTVKLTVTDSKGFSDYRTAAVTVTSGDELPTAAFSVTTTPQILAQPVGFDASASSDPDGAITGYTWNFGDGSAAGSGATPTHTYAAPGTYNVMVTVTDSSGLTAVMTHQITVIGPPAAAFSVTTVPQVTSAPIAFDATGSTDPSGAITAYAWNYGDGSAAGSGAKPSHTYAADGTYSVALTVTDSNGLSGTTTHQITVDELPSASFSVTTASPGQGQPVGFDATASGDPDGTITAYAWNYGDGSAAGSGATPSHTYAAGGTYTVTLAVTDSSGRSSTTSHSVVVAGPPTARFSLSPAHATPGQAVSFDGTTSSDPAGPITAYAWNYGDGSAAGSGAKPSHTYASDGTYTISLTVTDSSGLTASSTHQVTVDEPPSAAFAVTTASPLQGQPVAFDASASGDPDGVIAAYVWNYGDGSAAGSGAKPSHTYASAGSYTVTLTVTDSSGLSATTTHQVTVAAPPSAAFSVTTRTPALGQPVAFDASASNDPAGTITAFAWNYGDGSAVGSGATPTHTYATAGIYEVTLIVTDSSGLTAATSHQIAVLGPPTASFTLSPSAASVGQTVSFDASASSDPAGAIADYTWDFGDGSAGAGATPAHTYADPGTYNVTLTVTDDSGLTSSAGEQVSVDELPTAAFAVRTAHPASGVPVAFDGSRSSDPDGALLYQWNFGDGSPTGSGPAPRHTYRHRGRYLVSLVATDPAGLRASRSLWLPVALGGRITRISTKASHRSEFLSVELNAPGRLSVDSTTVMVRRPQSCNFKIRLSRAQLKALRRRHALRIRFKVEFVPVAGDASHQTATVTLHR